MIGRCERHRLWVRVHKPDLWYLAQSIQRQFTFSVGVPVGTRCFEISASQIRAIKFGTINCRSVESCSCELCFRKVAGFHVTGGKIRTFKVSASKTGINPASGENSATKIAIAEIVGTIILIQLAKHTFSRRIAGEDFFRFGVTGHIVSKLHYGRIAFSGAKAKGGLL